MGNFFPELLPTTELRQAVEETRFVPNPYEDDLHPTLLPLHYAIPTEALEAIRLFIERMEDLDESDYGDFMREANLFILDLEESLLSLDHSCDDDCRERLIAMQTYTQFLPNWDVNSTKKRLLSDARLIEHILQESDQHRLSDASSTGENTATNALILPFRTS